MKLAQLLILCVCLSACAEKRSLSALNGKPIASLSIRHTTPKFKQDRQLLSLISSKSGSPFSEEKIDHDIKRMWESGLVEDAKFMVKSDENFVYLTASLSTRLGCGPVLYRGNKAFSVVTLSKQISKPLMARIANAINITYDLATDEQIINRDDRLVEEVIPKACDQLEKFYRRKGFQDVKVRATALNGGPPSRNDFGFVIDELGSPESKAESES